MLDAGAFVALEKPGARVPKLLAALVRAKVPLATSGAVVAQVWRGGTGKQAPVAMLLPQVEVVPLDRMAGRLVGLLLGMSKQRDPADGHVVVIAHERGWPVLTSDPDDLRALDPKIDLLIA